MKRFVFALIGMLVASPVALGDDLRAGLAAYGRGDYAAALRELEPLAEHGNARAQFKLGLMYMNGQGVGRDYTQAAKWFRKVADQNADRTQATLGFMYYNNVRGMKKPPPTQ